MLKVHSNSQEIILKFKNSFNLFLFNNLFIFNKPNIYTFYVITNRY